MNTCDRCNAEAKVVVVRTDAIDALLQFCNHHYREHADALDTSGWTVVLEGVGQNLAGATAQ